MQQPPQQPCQKELTKKVASWLFILLRQVNRSQTHLRSHSWTLMFQLAILTRTCMVVSTASGLQVCTSLQSYLPSLLRWKLMPLACTAPMLNFHAKQYLKRMVETEKKPNHTIDQKGHCGNSSLCMVLRGNKNMWMRQIPRRTSEYPMSFLTSFQGEGRVAYWPSISIYFSQVRKLMAVPMTAVGANWQKLRYRTGDGRLQILNYFCSEVSFASSVFPS